MADYITKDLAPSRFQSIPALLSILEGAAPSPLLEVIISEIEKWNTEILTPAVAGLIDVHRATGIDLKHWEPVLRLVQSAEPTFSIEGEPEW